MRVVRMKRTLGHSFRLKYCLVLDRAGCKVRVATPRGTELVSEIIRGSIRIPTLRTSFAALAFIGASPSELM